VKKATYDQILRRRAMQMEDAVRQAFDAQQKGDLVKRLLSLPIGPNPQQPVIVVFTGYDLDLAASARDVSISLSNAPIFVLGPDNLCAADEAKRNLDAVTYRTHIMKLDEESNLKRRVEADASKDTQFTIGQATVASRWIEEEGFKTVVLVTAAYHQPRAYMTLLKSLIKRRIQDRVRLVPNPFCVSRDWNDVDPILKGNKSWASAFEKDELPKIIGYQEKRDVASWKELEEYLERL